MAEKKVQIQRIALNRQASIEFTLREPPRLLGIKPEDISRYNDLWHRWWEDTQNVIRSVIALKVDGQ